MTVIVVMFARHGVKGGGGDGGGEYFLTLWFKGCGVYVVIMVM